MSAGERIAAAARTLVGVRFRPQGRSAETGLDCIGVVALAAGVPIERVPADYVLRTDDPARMRAGFVAAGFGEVAGDARPGDVLVVRAGWGQAHAVVLTTGGFVHADAGLRRVVEVPGAVAWPVIGAWRVKDGR